MIGLLALLAACLLVLGVSVWLNREQKRERRETMRLLQTVEQSAADERAKLLEQVSVLLDRMSALIGRPWNLPDAPPLPNMPRYENEDLQGDELVGVGYAWEATE